MPKRRTMRTIVADFQNAVPCDSERCAVALGARAAFPEAISINIASNILDVGMGDAGIIKEHWYYKLPLNLRPLVIAFDARKYIPSEPIVFRVENPNIVAEKPVKVTKHRRSYPGTSTKDTSTGSKEKIKAGGDAARRQRTEAAKARKALEEAFGSGDRYLGMGVK